MPKQLTAKQECFAQLVASGATHTDAYRQSYNVKDGASAKSVWSHAYDLTQNGLVSVRIEELRQAAEAGFIKQRAFTADTLIDEAVINLEGARNDHQWGSANGALDWIGKATGLVSDKVQPGAVAVTKIVINLAPGVVMPASLIVDAPTSDESPPAEIAESVEEE